MSMAEVLNASLLITGGEEKERLRKAEEIFGFKLKEQTNNPDFFWLQLNEEFPTSLGVEAIRRLRQFLALKPFQHQQKNVLIQAEYLTPEAQNALLKTLEEPPCSTTLVLTCFEPSFLLPTIVSRCQIIQLPSRSQIALSSEESATIAETLRQLEKLSLNEKLALWESLGIYKDRQSAENWLNKLTFILRQQMLDNLSSGLKFVAKLKLIEEAKKQLQANCNVRLVMDCFLFNFSEILP